METQLNDSELSLIYHHPIVTKPFSPRPELLFSTLSTINVSSPVPNASAPIPTSTYGCANKTPQLLTSMLHQDLIIFQKPHFLPPSTNPITCNDKRQSRIPSVSRGRQNVSRLPTFLLSNVRSLNAKIDELQVVAQQNHVDVIAITGTCLNPEIPDGPVLLTDFSMVRKDRASGKRGGGVCAFIKSNIPFSTFTDLCAPEIECVWLKLRPHRLPRELSCIFVGVIYHPPSADDIFLQD